MSERSATDLSVKDFRNLYARGGYTWTIKINQLLAAVLAPHAIRRQLSPNAITVSYLVLGIATSAVMMSLYPFAPLAACGIALVGWQLAYTLDCLDGQVARSTGQASPQGAVFDLLCDYVVHGSIILVLLRIASPSLPSAFAVEGLVLLTMGWFISMYYSGVGAVLPKSESTETRALLVRVFRIGRDFGLHVLVLPVCAMLGATPLLVALIVIVSLDVSALVLGIYAFGTKRRTSL